jgi:hypothetical protein
VGVPVRNEVDRLPRLLTALADQRGAPPFTLCIFFDNCDDGSVQLVESWTARLPYAVVTDCGHGSGSPNAGLARRRALALALEQGSTGLLLTTDADSVPAPDWIATNLAALARADIVAGRIVRTNDAEPHAQDRISAYFDRLHAMRRLLDPVPWESEDTHHWTSGASLACRSDVYFRLGGFAPIASGEDAAFCDSAARAGFRVRRDGQVLVRTSSRRKGRAANGFAASLAALDGATQMPEVAHPDDEAWRFGMQASARAAYPTRDKSALAQRLGLPLAEVEQVAGECANAEAFAARIVGAPPGGMRMVSIAHAEALLTGLEQMALAGAA